MRIGFDAMMQAAARPSRIDAALHVRPAESGQTWRCTYLRCERLPMNHIEYCYRGMFTKVADPAERAMEYNACLRWPDSFPVGARELVVLLDTDTSITSVVQSGRWP